MSQRIQTKTIADKVVYAIRQLKSHKGSSRQAISKLLKAEFDVTNTKAVSKAILNLVKKNVLEQRGQSFLVKGEVYEEPEDERVQVEDIEVGDGEVATPGKTVVVSYTGKLTDENGHTFDSAKSFDFILGNGDVIKGWDRGVQGMKVGGKRKLVCPPKMGYGMKGSAPDIPPGATLHFIVGLLDVQ